VETLADIWGELGAKVRRFVSSRVNDAHAADDIAQDVMLKFQTQLESRPPGAKLPAWVLTVARNAVIDHYRTRRPSAPLPDLDAWPDPDEFDDRPNDATRELSRCLQPLLDQMAPSAREALVRVDVDGQTQQGAARDLGISVSGMKSRVQRARRELKALLEHCCVVELDSQGAIADYHPTPGACGCSATPTGC
jgi:RNA polymerase sigma-70 factor (ECF subfamily)